MSEQTTPASQLGIRVPDPMEERGSGFDRWFARLLGTPLRQRLWYWGGPLAVTLMAAIVRLWNLGAPRALVFDETYYVKDGFALTQLGYEGTWVDGSNPAFEAGDLSGLTTAAEYVVHPPLGKWMIGIGMQWFGADNAFGWRITTALAGVLAVWLVIVIGRRLTDSTALGMIAGVLFALDGSAIVMSRVAILDNWLMLFALLGAAAILADRAGHERRLAEQAAWARSGGTRVRWGAMLWNRPWLIAAGVAFGAASAVKWSGVWFLAAFGLYVVAVDAFARRRLGLQRWLPAALVGQGPISAVLMVVPALATYLASWTGWIVTSGGWGRDWARINDYRGPFPDWLASLWAYHEQAYSYHVSLTSSHPYSANPLTWLLMIRPTSMYYESSSRGENGCGFDSCSAAITGIGNPLIWWAATAAALYLYYRLIRDREWQVGFVLLGLAAGYLPWLMYLNRTVFSFYTIAFEPFLILALTLAIKIILGNRDDPTMRRGPAVRTVATYLGVVVAVSVFFLPLTSGMQVPFWFWNVHMWLPSWR